jgi:enoyl-CoA hydratase/carnithine racemase
LPELVKTELDHGVALIKINRPEVRNALNQAALHALDDALRRVGADASVHCAVLAGEGGPSPPATTWAKPRAWTLPASGA